MQQIFTHPLFLVGTGGALGSMARYGVARLFQGCDGGKQFPWSTFTVNVVGSFVLGLVAVWAVDRLPMRRELYFLMGTGFCGGFTTFSTFSLETCQLLQKGRWDLAMIYVAGSSIAGLASVWLAMMLGSSANSLAE
jgi:CrcB protein